jgi:LysM domain
MAASPGTAAHFGTASRFGTAGSMTLATAVPPAGDPPGVRAVDARTGTLEVRRPPTKRTSPRDRFVPPRRSGLRLVPPLECSTIAAGEIALRSPIRDAVSVGPLDLADGHRVSTSTDRLADAALRPAPAARPIAPAARPIAPAARPIAVSGRRRSPVHLTRRGRLVFFLVLLALTASVATLIASTVDAAPPARPPRAIVVHPGDTLWSIATAVHPYGSPTQTMVEIERLNHMTDGAVFVGQQLWVPAS